MSSRVVGDKAEVRWGKQNGLTVFDTLLVCILVAGLTGVFMTTYGRMIQEARETALKMDLVNIRLSIQLYRVLTGRYPGDLKELLSTRFLVPTKEGTIFSDQYLKTQTLDPSGYPIDPFGERYLYSPAKGNLSSGTAGYEYW